MRGLKVPAKDFRLSEEIEARNVITIIERLTKKLDLPLMCYFERLSEFAHPNYHGMMATYTVEGGIRTKSSATDAQERRDR